jgi:spermidine/putrescine transport system substrate-binding protein
MKRYLVLLILTILMLAFFVPAGAEGVVNVFNWEDYILEDVLRMFEEETGITVNYMRFTTNEDMIIQVTTNPSAFDVVFPSDYCVERLITDGMLAKIDFTNVPNSQYIMDSLLNPSYDPTGAYSVPYMWGTVGILYNKTMVKEPVTSWGILWDEKYKDNVFMMDSIRDTMGITLKYLGYSMNTRNPAELQAAAKKLIEQKQKGIVKAYQVDETKDKMVAGEAALALMWSGDAQYAMDLNSDLAYVVPDEGSNIWVDAMVIPKDAKNKENAEAFINFLSRPDIAKLNCEEIWYSTPNKGAVELMGKSYTDNTTMNPTQETISMCEFFSDIRDFITIYNTLWSQVKNAK